MKPKLRLTQVHKVQDLGPICDVSSSKVTRLRKDTTPGYQKGKTYASAYWQA